QTPPLVNSNSQRDPYLHITRISKRHPHPHHHHHRNIIQLQKLPNSNKNIHLNQNSCTHINLDSYTYLIHMIPDEELHLHCNIWVKKVKASTWVPEMQFEVIDEG
ncbi:hypothetical protein M758_11G073900, partial [Ceratodon purpureus]